MELGMLFVITSLQFNLPQGLLSSICYVESGHNVNAIHRHDGKGNSMGLCQIKLSTAKLMGFKGTEKDLLKPEINAYYAGKYLSHQIKRYSGSINKAVIAYNIGSAKQLTSTKYQARVFKQWELLDQSFNIQGKDRFIIHKQTLICNMANK